MQENKSLQEAENEVVDTFSMYDEWLDKYEYLIDLGKISKPILKSARLKINL